MGCGSSSPVGLEPSALAGKPGSEKKFRSPSSRIFMKGTSSRELTGLERRMQDALKAIIDHREETHDDSLATSFNRIILKFPAIRATFRSIKAVFEEYDVDSSDTIDKGELSACMRSLGSNLGDAEVDEMFKYAHMTDSKRGDSKSLTFKEFVLCLAIGSVLQIFPTLRAYSAVDLLAQAEDDKSRTPPSTTRSHTEQSLGNPSVQGDASVVSSITAVPRNPATLGSEQMTSAALAHLGKGQRLVKALKLVLEAYCLFDRDGSGTIDKAEVLAQVDEENRRARETRESRSHKTTPRSESRHSFQHEAGPVSSLLSRERWEELDWDSDGQITFKEFLFALMSWVGLDDDDEEGDATDDKLSVTASSGLPSTEDLVVNQLTLLPAAAVLAMSHHTRTAEMAEEEGGMAEPEPILHRRESSRKVITLQDPSLPLPPPAMASPAHGILKKTTSVGVGPGNGSAAARKSRTGSMEYPAHAASTAGTVHSVQESILHAP